MDKFKEIMEDWESQSTNSSDAAFNEQNKSEINVDLKTEKCTSCNQLTEQEIYLLNGKTEVVCSKCRYKRII